MQWADRNICWYILMGSDDGMLGFVHCLVSKNFRNWTFPSWVRGGRHLLCWVILKYLKVVQWFRSALSNVCNRVDVSHLSSEDGKYIQFPKCCVLLRLILNTRWWQKPKNPAILSEVCWDAAITDDNIYNSWKKALDFPQNISAGSPC